MLLITVFICNYLLFRCFSGEAYTSIKRLQEFLLRPESKESGKLTEKSSDVKNLNNGNGKYSETIIEPMFDKINHKKSEVITDKQNGICAISYIQTIQTTPDERVRSIKTAEKLNFIHLKNATATWDRYESYQMNGIYDFNTEIKPGLTAVVGPVGSGKSTFLNVILGELALDSGTITVNGSVSYASQGPWIFGGSVRSNIVFVEEFDEQRYNKVVEVCALERDFKLLPQGDATVVGEQGSSLSGGQKARVNLARTIYKQSDIYLLDDPLSAVDAHVGKHIFERCAKEFLSDKICVLVTHQIQYLQNVNHIILMKNGRIEAERPFQTLEKLSKESLMYVQEESEQNATETAQKEVGRVLSIDILIQPIIFKLN